MSVKDAKIKLDKRQAKAIALTIFTDIDAYIQAHPEAENVLSARLKLLLHCQSPEASAHVQKPRHGVLQGHAVLETGGGYTLS